MNFQLVAGRPDIADYLVFTTTFAHDNIFYKAALAETISWEGQLTGTYDVLLQSSRGTQRLTLVKDGEHWRAGEEVEQIGIIEQELVDLLGTVIKQVRK
jgi:hypothetical protein